MSLDVDLVVVGAGPAGTAAAIEAARRGASVLVLDKAVFPRDKCCGDGLTTSALRELEALGLQPDDVGSWQQVDDVVVRSPSGREVVFPLPRAQGVYAAVARRTDLDAALVRLALSAGAKVEQGTSVTAVAARGDGVVIETTYGSVTARHCVAADGMWSPVRRSLGLATDGYLGDWHAFRHYVSGVGPRASSQLMVWFEPDLLPGYAWSFPLPDHTANVGFGMVRDGTPTRDMAAKWREVLDRPHIREFLGAGARPEAAHKAWPIPARIGSLPLTALGGRVLFAGDAAGAPDPMTGEGIGQALVTGRLAAQGALGGDAYERAVRRAFTADDRMARGLGRLLRSPLATRGAVRVAGSTAWTRRHFARWLFEDYPRAYLVTPRRWRRHALSGPGAWPPTVPAHG